MHDAHLSAQLDAAWGDPDVWVANGLQWTHLEEVRALINRRISGDANIGPLAWFAAHLHAAGALPLRRVLVLGCGAGRVERELHDNGWAQHIVAFDLSPQVLAVARASAAGIPSIDYVQANMDDLPLGKPPFMPGSFDAVLGVASVHHCAKLQQLFTAVSLLLVPGGWFYLDEYIGPDRFQYSPAHMAQVCALADMLPARLLTTRSGQTKLGFRAPTVEEVMAVDPSEAVCSSQILPLLGEHFDVVDQRPYGGSLLHLLLSDVAQNFQTAQAKPWLHALIAAEEDFDRLGTLEQHFSCVIARQRPAASSAPRRPR